MVSVYALMVQSSSAIDAPRSSLMVFRAVVTTVRSSPTISEATEVRMRVQRCRASMCLTSREFIAVTGRYRTRGGN